MKNKTDVKKKTIGDEPVGKLSIIDGSFLPPPEKLAVKDDRIKVTILLDKQTIAFFKGAAKRYHAKYQKMMREVLKGYAKKYAR